MAVYMSQAAATVRQITTLARSGALCKTHLRLSPSAARVTFFFFFFSKPEHPTGELLPSQRAGKKQTCLHSFLEESTQML